MGQAIEVAGLTKTYADKGSPPLRAVDGIDFTVHAGLAVRRPSACRARPTAS